MQDRGRFGMGHEALGSPSPSDDICKESTQRSSSTLAQNCSYVDIAPQYSDLTRRYNACEMETVVSHLLYQTFGRSLTRDDDGDQSDHSGSTKASYHSTCYGLVQSRCCSSTHEEWYERR